MTKINPSVNDAHLLDEHAKAMESGEAEVIRMHNATLFDVAKYHAQPCDRLLEDGRRNPQAVKSKNT